MAELRAYAKSAVPRDVALQIRSYQRMQWPHLDEVIGAMLWDVPADSTARTFVVLDGEKLVSHAEANFRPIARAGYTFNVGGLSAVFTYPAYRGKGHAQQVVSAATAFLDQSDADLALLFCGESKRGLYASLGWVTMEAADIQYGDPQHPTRYEGGIVMVRYMSARRRAASSAFQCEPVYVGERTW